MDIIKTRFEEHIALAQLVAQSGIMQQVADAAAIIKKAAPIKVKISFCYYRLAKGISGILSYAKEGIRLWFRTKRPAYRQLVSAK